jgi:tRNA nucleotidyltransferase/poly(A) polymerase
MGDLAPISPGTSLAWSDAVLELAEILAGVSESVYIVGGAVRDAYLRRVIKDVDLVTSGSGMELARTIANRLRGAYYPLDAERDVGRALVETLDGRLIFDVACFRGDDLHADLLDRDFTINAIAVDLHGDLSLVIDPLNGTDDLKSKLLRRCSPQSISNDPLRALRGIRQSVQFALRVEPETLRDIRAVNGRLLEVSIERVRAEFVKMLALPKPVTALRVAIGVRLLQVIIPEVETLDAKQWQQTLSTIEWLNEIYMTISPARTDETAAQFSLGMMVVGLDRFRQQLYAHWETEWPDERPHRALLILAALLAQLAWGVAERRGSALRLSNGENDRLVAIIRHQQSVPALDALSPTVIYRYWKLTGEAGVDIVLLNLAKYLARAGFEFDQDDWLRQVECAQLLLDAYYVQRERFIEPPTLVNGDDLMKHFGLTRGRKIGELLELIREAQVNGEVVSAQDALRVARAHIDGK